MWPLPTHWTELGLEIKPAFVAVMRRSKSRVKSGYPRIIQSKRGTKKSGPVSNKGTRMRG